MTSTIEYYGLLARVAAQFYIVVGSPAERDAAYWYTRYAVRAVRLKEQTQQEAGQ